jgi:ABC-type branched-subunit amino acid transport system substrate-binding protein
VPLVLSNASTDLLSGEKCDRYVFRVSFSSSQMSEPIGLWMAKHAPKNMYIPASDYVAPREYVAAFKKAYLAGGGNVVGETYTPFGRTQDYGYVSQVRSANPGAVFAVYFGSEALVLVKQYDSFGMRRASALWSHRAHASRVAQGARRRRLGRNLVVELYRRARPPREPYLPRRLQEEVQRGSGGILGGGL